MQCGHRAQGVYADKPVCVTCFGLDARATLVDENPPDLTGREAKCSCGKRVPSSIDLPFFEYRGEGSHEAVDICVCGYAEVAHIRPLPKHLSNWVCQEFRSRGPLPDLFYCGCRGWD
jgi:hypothetical protein